MILYQSFGPHWAAFPGVPRGLRVGLRFSADDRSPTFSAPLLPADHAQQMISIGYFSLPVVGLTTLFTGMALALQIFEGTARFNAEGAVAQVVAIGMARELAPVWAA